AGVPAGALADRFDRRRLMLCSDLLGAVLALLVATLPAMPALIALAGLAMIVEAPFVSASRAVLPTLVGADGLARASAAMALDRSVGHAPGRLAGGPGAALVGARGVLLLKAASFLVSALLVARLPPAPASTARREPETGDHTRALDGFATLLASPALRSVTC